VLGLVDAEDRNVVFLDTQESKFDRVDELETLVAAESIVLLVLHVDHKLIAARTQVLGDAAQVLHADDSLQLLFVKDVNMEIR